MQTYAALREFVQAEQPSSSSVTPAAAAPSDNEDADQAVIVCIHLFVRQSVLQALPSQFFHSPIHKFIHASPTHSAIQPPITSPNPFVLCSPHATHSTHSTIQHICTIEPHIACTCMCMCMCILGVCVCGCKSVWLCNCFTNHVVHPFTLSMLIHSFLHW